MKKIANSFILLLIFTFSYAQEKIEEDKNQFTIAELEIRDVRMNDLDYTEEAIKGKNRLYFYRASDSDEILFSNYFDVGNTQSYGRIYNVSKDSLEQTEENYERDIYKFKWSYVNTYDDVVGTADITLVLEYKPKGIYFELNMIQDDLDENRYKGEFIGNVPFFDSIINKI